MWPEALAFWRARRGRFSRGFFSVAGMLRRRSARFVRRRGFWCVTTPVAGRTRWRLRGVGGSGCIRSGRVCVTGLVRWSESGMRTGSVPRSGVAIRWRRGRRRFVWRGWRRSLRGLRGIVLAVGTDCGKESLPGGASVGPATRGPSRLLGLQVSSHRSRSGKGCGWMRIPISTKHLSFRRRSRTSGRWKSSGHWRTHGEFERSGRATADPWELQAAVAVLPVPYCRHAHGRTRCAPSSP